jgi:hypothetical protein
MTDKNGWISVKDDMPKEKEFDNTVLIAVITTYGCRFITTGVYVPAGCDEFSISEFLPEYLNENDPLEDGFYYDEDAETYYLEPGWYERQWESACNVSKLSDTVTHWQPLPEPPEDN